jgi:hypothetical protein
LIKRNKRNKVKEAIDNLTDAVREFLEYVHEEGIEREMLPRPVSVETVRDFLNVERARRSPRAIDLKGYVMEVATIG